MRAESARSAARPRPAALDLTLAALADPTRRKVVAWLRHRPRRSSDIARHFAASRPAMSKHLGVLRRAGLVRESAVPGDARQRVYELRPQPLVELRDWLSEVEAFWSDQLRAFKAHAERPRSAGGA